MFKITSLNDTVNNITYSQFPQYERFQALQVGDYKLSSRTNDINGWLVCDGRSLSRATYKSLYDVIGTDFGNVDSDTFNLPDFTSCALGMFGISAVTTNLTNRTRGDKLGTETEVLTVAQIPAHSHTGTTDLAGTHTHTHNANGGAGTSGSPATGLAYSDGNSTVISTDFTNGELNVVRTPIALSIQNAGNHQHTFTTQNTGIYY